MANFSNSRRQREDGSVVLTGLKAFVFQDIERYFPPKEQKKLYDLISRMVMAGRYCGELKFDLKWLLEAETEFDPLIDPALDVLRGIRFEDEERGSDGLMG